VTRGVAWRYTRTGNSDLCVADLAIGRPQGLKRRSFRDSLNSNHNPVKIHFGARRAGIAG
jgi:hypothetical protein